MIKLLKIEFKKVVSYKVFWILIGSYFLFLGLGIFLAEFIINNWVNDFNKRFPIPMPHVTLYFFPDIWQNLTFFASIRYVLILPSIVIIILITNEFANKTIRQNIVNGLSKTDFLLSKLQFIFLLSVIITLIVAVVILVLGLLNSDAQGISMIFSKIMFIGGFFIQIFTYLTFAFFFGFIFQHTGLAIGLFTLYSLIVEPVIYYVLKIPYLQPNSISPYLPVNSVLRIVEYPAIPFMQKMMGFNLQNHVSVIHCGIALLYSSILIGIVFWIMNKKDL